MRALHALLSVIVTREHVTQSVARSRHRHIVLLTGTLFAEQHVPPVVIAIIHPLFAAVAHLLDHPRTLWILGLVVDTCQQLFHVMIGIIHVIGTTVRLPKLINMVHRPIASILIIGRGGGLLPTKTATIAHLYGLAHRALCGFTRLSGDQNHTESGARTINSRCRSILHHGDRLNVIRIQPRQIARITCHAIDDHQRVGIVNRIDTTYIDSTSRPWFSCRGGYIDTRYRALQHVGDRMRQTVFQFLAIHRSHSSREVHTLLRAIAYHNHLIQHLTIIVHNDVQRRAAIPFDYLSLITHITKNKLCLGSYFQSEIAIHISNRAMRGSFFYYTYPNEWLILRINNVSFQREHLSLDGKCADKQKKQHDTRSPFQKSFHLL